MKEYEAEELAKGILAMLGLLAIVVLMHWWAITEGYGIALLVFGFDALIVGCLVLGAIYDSLVWLLRRFG